MGNIHRPSDSGSSVTETTGFIQCINGQEPQINELWYQDLDEIYPEVHPTARVEILAVTIVKFVINYLAENGRQIRNTVKLSVNSSVQFLGLSDQAWGSGLMYTGKFLAVVEATSWGSTNDFNQIQGGRLKNTNSITNVDWGASFDFCPAYLPQIPVNPCAT